MSSTILDGLLAATVFTPGVAPAECVSGYMRNCAGSGTVLPGTVNAGHYAVIVEDALEVQKISINARAYNAAGDVRRVSVMPTVVGTQTQLDIYVRNDLGALSEDFVNCEVTVTRLPL
jgi:hypothetical protein